MLWLSVLALAADGIAATDVKVNFTLNTTDAYGVPIQEQRYYYLYRPDNLPRTNPLPMVLFMEDTPASPPASSFHRIADQAGFLMISCSFSGNSTGTPGTQWNADNPRITGYEDYDYISAVINMVRASDNGNEAFTAGVSKGGHISLAYACERPQMLRAAASIDEFMGLTSNIPSAPLPVILLHGTLDTNVPYTMVKDTVDAWRATDSLSNATAVTTYESSPLVPGMVSQATWRDPASGLQAAFVTIIGGTHAEPTSTIQTGYDSTAGLWAFFSQFLTTTQDLPKIVSQPVNNIQVAGQPASFRVAATGSTPLSYQWQRNGVDIPGATATWYTAPPTAIADNGAKFQAVVSNAAGSVTSASATLTAKAAPAGPTMIAQPADESVAAGQPAGFAVTADGTPPLTYQWLKNGMIITGATSGSFAMPAAITADSGASFTVTVTNAAGSVTSTRGTLTVTPAATAPVIFTNPARARVLVNQQASFWITAWSLTPMTFQWQKGTLNGNMADIPGATDAIYTTPSTTLADHLTLFRCVASNAAGSMTSASEMLFVTAARTAPTAIASDTTVFAQTGVPFAYTIISSGGTAPVTYSASPLPGGLQVDPNSGLISGIPAAAGTTSVAIQASNSAGKFSTILTLTVTDTPPAVSINDWRLANFGASATDPSIAGDMADPDGDGYTNLDEYRFGSQPLNPASVPTALAASPSTNDFGTVAAGASAQATVAISNTGGSSLSGTATVSGDPFAIVSDAAFTLPANGSADMVVSFTPMAAGTFNGQVMFSSNGGSATVNVTGIGMVATVPLPSRLRNGSSPGQRIDSQIAEVDR